MENPVRQGRLESPWEGLVGGVALGDRDWALELLKGNPVHEEEQTEARRGTRRTPQQPDGSDQLQDTAHQDRCSRPRNPRRHDQHLGLGHHEMRAAADEEPQDTKPTPASLNRERGAGDIITRPADGARLHADADGAGAPTGRCPARCRARAGRRPAAPTAARP